MSSRLMGERLVDTLRVCISYFINDIDEIKSIADPSKTFEYRINKNERYNEKQREAMNCMSPMYSFLHTHRFSLQAHIFNTDPG